MEIVRNIKLSGSLARQFGRNHFYAVASVAEAIRAMCYTIPGFEKFLMEAKDNGLVFAVLVGDRNVPEEELKNPVGEGTIRIIPLITGSKKAGTMQIIVGAVLIIIGIVVQVAFYGAPNPISNYLYGAGISMIVGGLVQLLSPQPKTRKDEAVENGQSYIFNGAVNTQAQGNPVPLLYGELFTGSAVVSAGISTKDNYVVPRSGPPAAGEYRRGGSMMGNVMETAYAAQ